MNENIKLTEQEIIRREKLKKYEDLGVETFKKFDHEKINIYSNEIIDKYSNFTKDDLLEKQIKLIVAGRVLTQRGPFIVIQDTNGKIQLYIDKKELEEQKETLALLDIGDIIYVKGTLMKTMKGELTIKVNFFDLLTKGLTPLAEKYHGLVDVEERYRKRYLDLISNPNIKEIFWTRTKIISKIREFFDKQNFMEVETPMLHSILGGANAQPFKTYHNSLSSSFNLRIATELPLKKLLVGGIDRVYEIGRIFRNEGIDTTHNPEFTSIEFYQAYSNLEIMMEQTENLIKFIAKELGLSKIKNHDVEIDLLSDFKKINMVDAVSEATKVDFRNIDLEKATEIAKAYKIKVEKYFKVGHIINELFELLIEKTLVQPTFVMGHPIEVSPLAACSKDKRFTERAELFINTKEYANMFTELNDPLDQRRRFEAQFEEKESGNEEASEIDEDFLNALEYGLPPAGGCGIGIDRLVMLLTQKESIREVILFPTLKKKQL
ncbi:lysine--tRNA ligase [Mycoplasmopsis pulmonis]|uniref:lysine--tRNA ligase n=1 Tax=Mycoplasmopsis pulmonis TaxID=2107 RepID=UPI002ACE9A38|nr:lysine--tRNA ligase [Mycoplasmopsis pulmonis]MDZ7293344.1 lysine--tRNA ligase [Mycoplasmopsis pulmonis]